ncbi:hypothetical protein RJZ57_008217, partial [Blastomyces gilchristii]
AQKKRMVTASSSTMITIIIYVLIWGNGWANSDNGKMFEDKLQNCALLPNTFQFVYELGVDGREYATTYTTIWEDGCVTAAAKQAGAQSVFDCRRGD